MSGLKIFLIFLLFAIMSSKDQCGKKYGKCDGDKCCSKYGYCGTDDAYCGSGCQKDYGKCKSSSSSSSKKDKDKKKKEKEKKEKEKKEKEKKEKEKKDKKKEKKDDDDSGSSHSGDGKVDWVGFRFSEGGVKKQFGKIPDPDSWVSYVNKFKKHFNSDAKGVVIVIVAQNSKNKIARFGFPAPSGIKESSYVKFDKEDKFEKILSKFDESGVNVWLQVEPGDNDLVKVAEITFKRYGHHSCVKGFGVDLEWWYREGDHGKGKKISDDKAKKIVEYVRGINSEYTVFLKHWETEYMPPTYRDGLVFVDDCQDFKEISRMQRIFGRWAKAYPDNPVMFQIGYKHDTKLWSDDPIHYATECKNEVTKYNSHVGIIWVDFTMKEALDRM